MLLLSIRRGDLSARIMRESGLASLGKTRATLACVSGEEQRKRTRTKGRHPARFGEA